MTAPNTKCQICQKPIYRIPSRLRDGLHFCSYGCRNSYFSIEKSFVWKGGKAAYITRGRQRDKVRKLERKKRAIKLKGGKCMKCGYNRCIGALDFHHLDPSTKESTLKYLWDKSWERIEAEIEKCVLWCCRCHREYHWNESHE